LNKAASHEVFIFIVDSEQSFRLSNSAFATLCYTRSGRTYLELKQDREIILAQGVCLYYGDAMKNQQTFFFGLLKNTPKFQNAAR
jgi:hypothetical protein